jgi:hypothetical protein
MIFIFLLEEEVKCVWCNSPKFVKNEHTKRLRDVQEMTTQLREGTAAKKSEAYFEGEIEFDELYVVAGHKGNPEEVKKNRQESRNRIKGAIPMRIAGSI